MWDRTILKSNAKLALSNGKYWTAYAACLIVTLITGVVEIFKRFSSQADNPFAPKQYDYRSTVSAMEETWHQIKASLSSGFLTELIAIFVGLVLAVGLARFFVRNRFGETRLETVFSGFSHEYGSLLGGMFVTRLFIYLWMLLLVVPGIIKALEYIMVKYILSDNASMPGARARQISSMMTNGEKGDIFVLELSFIGWYLLAAVVIGIVSAICWPISGIVGFVVMSFVTAYREATFAELYVFMRDRAIRSGAVNPAELGLSAPVSPAV